MEISEHSNRELVVQELLTNSSTLGKWECQIRNNTYFFNRRVFELLGYNATDQSNFKGYINKITDPEDMITWRDYVDNYLKNAKPPPFQFLLNLKHKNGNKTPIIFTGDSTAHDKSKNTTTIGGICTNLSVLYNNPTSLQQKIERYDLVVGGINAGIWDWDITTGEEWWSPRFYMLLGYEPNEIEPTYENFLELLLHPDDKEGVLNAVNAHLTNGKKYKLEVRMLSKAGKYIWFETSGQASFYCGDATRMVGTIILIDYRKKQELEELEKNNFIIENAGEITKTGGWEYNIVEDDLFWTKQVYKIHELPEDYHPTVKEAIDFYHPDSRPLIAKLVKDAIEKQQPYDQELRLITAKGKTIWVRGLGKPVLDNRGKVIALRGIFQNIEKIKNKEAELLKSLDLVSRQNNRLINFAYIVSHNLRSHAGNLSMMVNFLKEKQAPDQQEIVIDHIHKISKGFEETVKNLNEVVQIHENVNKDKTTLSIEEIYQNVITILTGEIEASGTIIKSDFSACPNIKYFAAYLESILLNLISNSIKYRDERKPKNRITIKSYLEHNNPYLEVTDNGLGLDLSKYGEKLFGMYKTFHKNENSRGIGLFITKNQIESLGGTISVVSEVHTGSTFKVKFYENSN